MQVIISAKNVTLTSSMSTLAAEKLERLDRFWSALIRCRVEVIVNRRHKHGEIFAVYGWVEVPGHDLRATVESSDFRSAIDELYDKLERLVKRAKERRGDKRVRSS